jgi:hypothetical protein
MASAVYTSAAASAVYTSATTAAATATAYTSAAATTAYAAAATTAAYAAAAATATYAAAAATTAYTPATFLQALFRATASLRAADFPFFFGEAFAFFPCFVDDEEVVGAEAPLTSPIAKPKTGFALRSHGGLKGSRWKSGAVPPL